MKKKLIAMLMAVIMCVICPVMELTVHAEGTDDYLLYQQGVLYATAQNSANYSFYSDKYQRAYLYYLVDHPVELLVSLKKAGSNTASNATIVQTDWEETEVNGQQMYATSLETKLYQATYTYTISCNEDVAYAIAIEQVPTLSATSTTITAGQKKTLEVINADDTITWSSNKTSVATVSSKGVITAKKAGTAIITATVGQEKLTCKVTVQKNVYKREKVKVSETDKGFVTPQIYNVSYKNDTIVCKVNIINRADRKVKSLENIVITIKDQNGKTIAKQKFSKKAVSVSKGKSKTVTFTISKKNVKNKKADLVYADCAVTGQWK